MSTMPEGFSIPSTTPCPLCRGATSAREGWYHACSSCGFQFSNLRPGGGASGPGLERLRRSNFNILLNHLAALRPLTGLRLLDVGSAHGWFMQEAARRGLLAKGIEPLADAAAEAKANGLDVIPGFFPQDLPEDGLFDVIVFNDVFEHLPDPSSAITAVEKRLAPRGQVVINLPCADGVFYRVAKALWRRGIARAMFERLWQKDFASPHLSYFTPRTLQALVEGRTQLRCVACFPLLTLTRQGLWSRIALTHRGPSAALMFALLTAASFVLAWLPADIVCLIFEKPESGGVESQP